MIVSLEDKLSGLGLNSRDLTIGKIELKIEELANTNDDEWERWSFRIALKA